MSSFIGNLITAEVALTAATAKTVVQLIAATNHRVKILGISVSFDGVSATAEPVVVKLARQSTAGTMSSLTPTKQDDSIADTLLTTGQHTATGTEPTTGDTLDSFECHPQSGVIRDYPFGQEPIIGGGDRVGIVCTAPAGVNVIAAIRFEE